jgi:hypothetical protein
LFLIFGCTVVLEGSTALFLKPQTRYQEQNVHLFSGAELGSVGLELPWCGSFSYANNVPNALSDACTHAFNASFHSYADKPSDSIPNICTHASLQTYADKPSNTISNSCTHASGASPHSNE